MWSGEQGPHLLQSHLCSFQVPPCSLWRDKIQLLPCWECFLSPWTWTLTCSSLPFLLLLILHLQSFTCAEESPVLTHPDPSEVLSLPSAFPYSLPHGIHAKCNYCRQCRKHRREWSCVNEGEDMEGRGMGWEMLESVQGEMLA